MSIQLGQFGVSERLILCMCLLRPMCPVMMHIPVRYLVRLLRLFVSILSVFLWWLPSMRLVCACLLGCALFYKPIWQLTVNERGHYADSEDTFLLKIEDSPDTRLGA